MRSTETQAFVAEGKSCKGKFMANSQPRKNLLREIEEDRDSKVILYVTGDRQGLQTQIGQDVIDLFVDHLDLIGPVGKISLVLYTSGGSTSAAWNLVNLLQMFCDDFEVIAPGKCMSAGTLISLGADRIIMTKQATLGPIDPSLQHPLGPAIPGAAPDARAPVSVEAVNGYLEAIRGCRAGTELEGDALLNLSDKVHPLVLGQIFRSRQQIRDLADKLLNARKRRNSEATERTIDFLCSDSGSHDCTINQREAVQLGLQVSKCSENLYGILRNLRKSFSDQMMLREPYDLSTLAQPGKSAKYEFTHAVIESIGYGAHHFVSIGQVEAVEMEVPNPAGGTLRQIAFHDQREFEGWREIR